MTSTGIGSNSLSTFSSIIKYSKFNYNTSIGFNVLNDTKLNVVSNSNNWKSVRFGTLDAGDSNSIILGIYNNIGAIDENNLNFNASIISYNTNNNKFKDLFINNFGINSNTNGNVIIQGKTTIGDYYNSKLYNHSLDIKGTSNILNLRSANNTLEFICDINSNFNINTSNNKLFINTSINTSNITTTKLNINYKYPILSEDILLVAAGNSKFEDNSTINIGSNTSNNLNIYGNIYISENVRIGNKDNSGEKIIISTGITKFKDNSIVNIGENISENNIINIYGKANILSNVGIGTTNNPTKILSVNGNTLFNNATVDIGTSISEINKLNVYGKCYIASNLGIGTITDSNYILKVNSGTTLFDNNSTILIGSNNVFNNRFQILGNSYLNGKVIIGNSNVTAESYGLFINSNVYISKGLTVTTTSDDSNSINIMGKAFISSNLTINTGSTIYGSGFGLSNIKVSSLVNNTGDIIGTSTSKIPSSYLNLNPTHFELKGEELNIQEMLLSGLGATITETITWIKTLNGFGYYVINKKIKIGGNNIESNSAIFSVGSNENIIRTADYIYNPTTKIGTVDTNYSNTSISLIAATFQSNTINSYLDIPLGSIIYTISGSNNCQHIFEYNNKSQDNTNVTQLVINKSGLISINSNISNYVELSNEKLIINGSVNILNCNISTPSSLIIGNSNLNNSIINAHGTVFVGSNIIIGNTNLFNSFAHKSLSRIKVASGTTEFANYTNLNIGNSSVNSSNNNLTIYANIGIGTANTSSTYNYLIQGNTLFNGSIINFNDKTNPSQSMLISFKNSYVGIGTDADNSYVLKIKGDTFIEDGSEITLGTINYKENINKLHLYSRIGIGTYATDNLLNIGPGNIEISSNINLTYGGSVNAYNCNTINLYSKVGIGTTAKDGVLLNIGNISNTININNTSTINIGDQIYNSNTKLNINGNTKIEGKTVIGGVFDNQNDDQLINLHIKTETKFYNDVYFAAGTTFTNLTIATDVTFNDITVNGIITGKITSDGINSNSDFGTIYASKINYDPNYFISDNNSLSLNTTNYDLWRLNTANNNFIYYNKNIYITSESRGLSNYIPKSSFGLPFQIDVDTSINCNLYLGTNSTSGQYNENIVLNVYGKSLFKNSINFDNTNNSEPTIFKNINKINIVQIGNNDDRPNIDGYQLNVNGNIGVTGNIYTNSDLRLKNNILTVNNALEKIIKCRGVNFNYLNEDKINIGVIAQEIEKIIPEVVETQKNGFKTVNYLSIIGVLIESIKELNNKIDNIAKTTTI